MARRVCPPKEVALCRIGRPPKADLCAQTRKAGNCNPLATCDQIHRSFGSCFSPFPIEGVSATLPPFRAWVEIREQPGQDSFLCATNLFRGFIRFGRPEEQSPRWDLGRRLGGAVVLVRFARRGPPWAAPTPEKDRRLPRAPACFPGKRRGTRQRADLSPLGS